MSTDRHPGELMCETKKKVTLDVWARVRTAGRGSWRRVNATMDSAATVPVCARSGVVDDSLVDATRTRRVQLGDGKVVESAGTVDLEVCIGEVRHTVTFEVLDGCPRAMLIPWAHMTRLWRVTVSSFPSEEVRIGQTLVHKNGRALDWDLTMTWDRENASVLRPPVVVAERQNEEAVAVENRGAGEQEEAPVVEHHGAGEEEEEARVVEHHGAGEEEEAPVVENRGAAEREEGPVLDVAASEERMAATDRRVVSQVWDEVTDIGDDDHRRWQEWKRIQREDDITLESIPESVTRERITSEEVEVIRGRMEQCLEESEMPLEVRRQMEALMSEFEVIFHEKIKMPKGRLKTRWRVETRTERPIRAPVYNYQGRKRAFLVRTGERLRLLGLIGPEPSMSEYRSNPILSRNPPKKAEEFRLCVDGSPFSKANELVTPSMPMDDMDAVRRGVMRAKIVTGFDVYKGFWIVAADEETKNKSATIWPINDSNSVLLEWNVMPFGFGNCSQTFKKAMLEAFEDLEGVSFMVDNIFVMTGVYDGTQPTMEEWSKHMGQVRELFRRCDYYGITLKLKSEAVIGRVEKPIQCFGYVIVGDRMIKDPQHYQAVMDFPFPKDIKEYNQFNGVLQWLAKNVDPQWIKVGDPFFQLGKEPDWVKEEKKRTGKTPKWKFKPTQEQVDSFALLKREFRKQVEVTYPRQGPQWEWHVVTDWSKPGVGCYLLQCNVETGQKLLVAVAAKRNKPSMRNAGAPVGETLGALVGSRQFRSLISDGRTVVQKGDQQSLKFIMRNMSSPNSQIDRALRELREHVDRWEAIPAGKLVLADQLGRMCDSIEGGTDDNYDVANVIVDQVGKSRYTGSNMIKAQELCPEVLAIRAFLKKGKLPRIWEDSRTRQAITLKKWVTRNAHSLVMKDGLLWLVNEDGPVVAVYYLPLSMRTDFLKQRHDSLMGGHISADQMIKSFASRVTWAGMRVDCMEYYENCEKCNRKQGGSKKYGDLKVSEVATGPSDRWVIDLIGPFTPTKDGNRFILHVVVLLPTTNFHLLSAMANKTAKRTARSLVEKHICTLGIVPREIQSDNGKEFKNNLLDEMGKLMGYNQVFSSPYRPQTNAAVERPHIDIEAMLRVMVDPVTTNDWDEFLPYVAFAINTAERVDMESGVYGLMGVRPDFPRGIGLMDESFSADEWSQHFDQIREVARINKRKVYQQRKKRYDEQHKRLSEFKVGDIIRRSVKRVPQGVSKKLSYPWSKDRWEILDITAGGKTVTIVKIVDRNVERTEHIANIKKAENQSKKLTADELGAREVTVAPEEEGQLTRNEEYVEEEEQEDTYEVETVLDSRYRKGIIQYRVKFVGYDNRYNMWLPESNLDCDDLIREYNTGN